MTWFDRIIPPDDPKKLATWRLCIAAAVILLLANGYIGRAGVWGLGQYAYANEMAAQGEALNRIEAMLIASRLDQLHKEQCRANGNRDVFQRTIEDYQQMYIDATGERYPLLPCEGDNS